MYTGSSLSFSKIETTQGLCVVALTKHLMKKYGMHEDKAFAKLIQMELYALLMNADTNLFLETNDYLCEACDHELSGGSNSLHDFINS